MWRDRVGSQSNLVGAPTVTRWRTPGSRGDPEVGVECCGQFRDFLR